MFKYESLSPSRKLFIDSAVKIFPDLVTTKTINRSQIAEVCHKTGINTPQWLTINSNSVSRAEFKFPVPEEIDIVPVEEETDEQIAQRIDERFSAIDLCVKSVAYGDIKSLILSGPPGIGKTYEVTKTLEELDQQAQCNYTFVSGKTKATGLFKLLYDNRFPDCVLVLDDIDSVFDSEDSLNILKKACDLRNTRKISWLSESKFVSEEDGEEIPKHFEYEGSIIFITNKDFDSLIRKDSKLTSHLEALMSRSLYINLGINTTRDILIRIEQVFHRGMMKAKGFNKHEEDIILDFINSNTHRLREISLRMCEMVGTIYKTMGKDWESVASISCFKR